MIPGSNLLNMAFGVIAKTTVSYLKYLSRATNVIGLDVSTYADPINLMGSWQPVPRNKYEAMGLDFNKNYAMFYVSKDILDLQRNVSGDQIQYAGKTWNCLSETDWFGIDGWTGVLCEDSSYA